MPKRAIHTVFTVGGENTYRDAVKRVNAAIKELNSELELTKERFAGQEDSYTALFTKQQQMERLYEAQNELAGIYASRLKQIQDNTNELNRYSEELRDTLNQIQAALHTTSETSVGYDELAREARDVEDELRAVETQMGKNATKASELETGINKAHTEMERLSRELEELDPLVEEASSSMDGLAKSMVETAEDADKLKEKGTAAVEALASSEVLDRSEEAFLAIADGMRECVDAYIEFETAIAGVEKTVEATEAQMGVLVQGIRDMALEIPATTTEIAGIAEQAGELGIATEDILEFTEVMIKLGTSTNMAAEEAADSLARFANITDMDPKNYEKLGSAIVALGNKSAATETEIVEMATRLAATGELIGLSEPEILGMAAALSSLGIEAEAGGTAASKLFKKLESAVAAYKPAIAAVESTGKGLRELELLESNKSKEFKETADSIGLTSTELGKFMDNLKLLEQISGIAGQSVEEFASAWGENTIGALDDFITGLGEMEAVGGNAVDTLNQIAGFTEVRLSNAVLALASSGGLLAETMDVANEAWKENSALAEEAAKRYETKKSKIQILENAFDNLKITIGEDFGTTMEPIIEGLTKLAVSANEAAESGPGLSSALAGVAGALGAVSAVAGAAGTIKLVTSALSLFGGLAGPVRLAAAATGAAGGALLTYVTNVRELPDATESLLSSTERMLASQEGIKEKFDTSNTAIETNKEVIDGLILKLAEWRAANGETGTSTAEIEAIVSKLNELIPGLGLEFEAASGKINMATTEIQLFAEESERVAKMDAYRQFIEELTIKQTELEVQQRKNNEAVAQAKAEYEAAAANEKAFREGMTALEEVLKYTNPQYITLAEKLAAAKHNYEELAGAQEATKKALEDTQGSVDIAVAAYKNLAAGVEEAAGSIAKIGGGIADGLIAAMEEKATAVGYAAQRLARGAVEQMGKELEINSPSKKTYRMGIFVGEGIENALYDKITDIQKASDEIAKAIDITSKVDNQIKHAQDSMVQVMRTEGANDSIPIATGGTGGAVYSGGEGRGDGVWYTVENMYVTVDASSIEEFNDIIELAADAQRAERALTGRNTGSGTSTGTRT